MSFIFILDIYNIEKLNITMPIDLKILAKKFLDLGEVFEDQTLIKLVFKPRRIIVKRSVNGSLEDLFRVNKAGEIKVARYFEDDIRRQDKFQNGLLASVIQTLDGKTSGSQIRLRGNKKTWIHKDKQNDVNEILDDLFNGNYNLLTGPAPGGLGIHMEALKQFGNSLRDEFDLKKVNIRIKVDGTNIKVKSNDRDENDDFVTFTPEDLH